MGKQKMGKEAPAGPSQRDGMSEKTGGTEALTQHTEVILAAIQDSKTALQSQIAMLAGEVGLLRDDHNKLKDRVKATEVTMQETTSQVKTLTQKLALMVNELRTLASKVEDAESRSRCHNIRLVGVPERAEGPSIELYIETWLSEVVLRGTPTKFFSVERAHRIPAVPPPPGAYPRPITVNSEIDELQRQRCSPPRDTQKGPLENQGKRDKHIPRLHKSSTETTGSICHSQKKTLIQ
ncbi:hypothetical protein NDU88_002689 [Pleurodeles waltl]|uniref:Uncharacterized protein n=1 Tax=Pleurodeles waltl TaxID=8319 RepID=A0AAV7REJ4_PLEWA|nr:hypothetical protein NDU88_002689 [Pleurodeles waltl]